MNFLEKSSAFVLGLALLGWTSGESAAQTNGVLTLQSAIAAAKAKHPGVRASVGQVAVAQARAAQARLWSNPDLELSAEDLPLQGGRGYSDAKQLAGVAQTFPYPGKKKLDSEIGRLGVRVSEQEAMQQTRELVRDVKVGFFRVLAAERSVQVATELLNLAEHSAAITRQRVEAGAIPVQEQLRGEIQMQRVETELVALKRDLDVARENLRVLIGLPAGAEIKLGGQISESVDPGLLAAARRAASSPADHPRFKAAQAALERARAGTRRARLEPYPDVRAGVAGGVEGSSDRPIIQFGISLPLPIIDRGKAKTREAAANETVAEAELAVAEQSLRRELQSGIRQFEAAVETLKEYHDRLLPRVNEALRLVQVGFEEGKFGFIDLADTQRTAAEIRLAYQEKILELNIAQAELEALLPDPSEQIPN